MKLNRVFFVFVAAFVGMVSIASAQGPAKVEILTQDKGVTYDAGTQVLTDHITKCSIKAPLEPTSKLTRAQTPHGTIMVRSHSVNLGNMVFTMTQTKHPAKLLQTMGVDLEKDAAKFIEMSSQFGARSRKDAKVRSRREHTLDGIKGLELAISYPDASNGEYKAGLTIERTYIQNGLLYVVMVEVPREVLEKDRNSQKGVLALLDSFAILTAKKKEPAAAEATTAESESTN